MILITMHKNWYLGLATPNGWVGNLWFSKYHSKTHKWGITIHNAVIYHDLLPTVNNSRPNGVTTVTVTAGATQPAP